MNQNRIYIVLTLILISLSLGGLIYFYRPVTKPTLLEEMVATPTQEVSQDIPPITEISEEPSTPSEITPSAGPTSMEPELSYQPEATPTPTISTLTSLQFGFEVPYASSRKLYESPENGGTRYTLYSASGNITVHAGSRWSWLHPGREFNADLTVSGRPTFVYKISSQTLVDFEVGDTKITVQCVHGGKQSLIDECQKFLSDFRLTTGS
ncbi:MAG: hypothetical protein WC851_00055 [Candidatus Shapirobacteria bacterium]